MPNNEFEGFQPGIQGQSGGLQFQDLSVQGRASLKIDTNIDLGKLGAFGAQKIDLTSMADQIHSSATGLQTNLDIGSLGESVRKIKANEKSDRVRALLEEAQQLLEKREYRKAVTPIDKALGIEPGSPRVLVMKAYVFIGLEDFAGAIDALRKARTGALDSETRVLTIFMESMCARAITRKIEEQLGLHLKEKKFSQALAYIESQIRAYPENPVLPYHRSRLLMLVNRYAEAKAAALETMNRVPTMRAVCEQVLEEIAVAENVKCLDAARGSLRRGDSVGAMDSLNQCRAALGGTEHFEAIRSYTDPLLPRGLFSSVFRKDRSAPLDESTLQRVLMWLLAEELDAGTKALSDGKYSAAMQQFEKSYQIDARCNVISYLHALAIVKELERLLAAKQQPDPEEWAKKTRKAAVYLAAAAQDPLIAQQTKPLAAVVQQYSSLFARAAQAQETTRPINELYAEFNSFTKELSIKSPSDLERAEAKLKDMRGRTQSCLRNTRDATGRKHLEELLAAIDKHLAGAKDARKQARRPAPPATSSFDGSAGQQLLAIALTFLQQINEAGYIEHDKQEQYRNAVTMLRAQVRTMRKGLLSSADAEALKTTDQVLTMIESKL